MKKTIFGKALALLAAGALLFGAISCTDGAGVNDEHAFASEEPTTYNASYGAAAKTSSVTAVWTFAADNSGIGAGETSWSGKQIAPDSGSGAYLIGGDPCVIKYVAAEGKNIDNMGANDARIQASNKTASITDWGGAVLKLITEDVTNIVVRAAGAGAATPARILVITDKDGNPLVYKDNLASNGNGGSIIPFYVSNAPAGEYYIYFNGSTIYEVNCNPADSKNAVTAPTAYKSSEGWALSFVSGSEGAELESLMQIASFTLKDAGGKEITTDATWKLLEGDDIADVSAGIVSAKSGLSEGKVKVRARIGRFYVDSPEFSFKKTDKSLASTFVLANLPAKDTKLLNWAEGDADTQKVLATKVVGGATPIVEVVEDHASIEIASRLHVIEAKDYGTYTYNEATEAYSFESSTSAGSMKGEMWAIKAATASTGGVTVKSHIAENSTSSDQKLDDPIEWFTVKYTVKPAAGKTVKVTGVRAHLISGGGAGHFGLYVSKDGEAQTFETNGNTSSGAKETATDCFLSSKSRAQDVCAWVADFATPIVLSDEGSEFTFTVKQRFDRKSNNATSIALDDLGLVCVEE